MSDKRPVVQVYKRYPRVFDEWGIAITLVKGIDGKVYFPVRQVCEELGVSPEKQLHKLNETADYRQALVEMPLPTPGGTQKTVCMRKREAAWWLINIDDAHCKPHIKGHLQEIKQRLMDAAEAILFGDIAREEAQERGILVVSSRDEYVIACLDCGARHRVIVVNGKASATLERED